MLAITQEDAERMRSMIRENIIHQINNEEPSVAATSGKTFLTQFNEKEEEEKPRNAMNADKTKSVRFDGAKTGVLGQGLEMKLQRNILARYRVDDEVAKKELSVKRQEFEKRINQCKEKQSKLMIKQDNNQLVVQNFSQFINEKETIRKRAIVKYQMELKMRLQKTIECDLLLKELEAIRKKHEKKSSKVLKNKKFKDFLSQVIELLPDDYLESGESKYKSLMSRYDTLYECNVDLFEGLMSNADKLKMLRNEYERIIIEHNSNKMSINSKMGELQKIREEVMLRNENVEEVLNRDGEKMRGKVIDLSKIFWSINNLADKCIKPKFGSKPVDAHTLDEKLNSIADFINKQSEIIKIVHDLEPKTPPQAINNPIS